MRIQAMSGPLAGVAAIPENCNYSYKQSVRGAVFHLRKAGHSVDFVTPGQDLSGYDLVVAGTWEMVPENAVDSLKKYVADGGTLLIEYPFACRDEKTWCALKRPASQLDELTGCFEAHRISLPKTAGGLGSELPGTCVIPDNPETRGELAGFSYDDGSVDLATYCKVELTPTTGSVLAHWKNGTAAVVRNSYGKGTVFTCGGNTAIATAEHGFFTGLPVLYKKALECAGLKVDTSDVWSVERASGEHLYRFLFQMGKEPFSMEVPAGFEVVYTSAGANSDGKNIQFAPHATVVLQRKN
jgi:beta-galactosidase GanA